MSSAAPGFRVATEADLPAIARTLALAFEHDPVWAWTFEGGSGQLDRERKIGALEVVFEFAAASVLPCGWVRVTAAVEAAAIWVPPGCQALAEDEERFPARVRQVCGEAEAARILAAMEVFESVQPGPEHYFLNTLGTDPAHAGQGHGMGLLAACVEEIDAAGAPAFLETSVPALVPRYERHGFRLTHEETILTGIPSIQMWRH